MKLLLDENLSVRLLPELIGFYPNSAHVSRVGLHHSNDREVWQFARKEGFWIVTKDADFYEMALLYGPPPKIVWLRCGNQKSEIILRKLIANKETLEAADQDDEKICVEIF